MKIYKDESIRRFEFWGEAKDNVNHLMYDEMDTIESILKVLYPEGMTETELNTLFWFGRDKIAEWLGYSDFETMIEVDESDRIIIGLLMTYDMEKIRSIIVDYNKTRFL